MSEETKEGFIHSIEKVPELDYFFGREEEIEEISDFMDSETYTTLTLRGIAGIGKTALLSKIVDLYKDKKNIFLREDISSNDLEGASSQDFKISF